MSSEGGQRGEPRRGRLIVISGPSGAGKTSVCNALLAQLPDTVWSVSVTTRSPRRGEKSGESYEFVSPEAFEERVQAGAFLEFAKYVGHRYGTPREPVDAALKRGDSVVLEIDVQGGLQVAAAMPESIRIFLLPPDGDALRARLEGRATEAQELQRKRLAEADGEIATARDSGCYQHFVVNEDLNETIERVKSLIRQESRIT